MNNDKKLKIFKRKRQMSDDSKAKNNREQIRFTKISKTTWQHLIGLQNIWLQQGQFL